MVVGGQDHRSRGAVAPHQVRRAAYVDNLSVLDDGHAVAQPLGLLHQMSGHKDRFATVANATHQIPDGAARLRIQTRGQLIQKYHFGIVDQRQCDEQPLLLAAGKRHEPGVPFAGETQLFEQPVAIYDLRVQRRPQVYGFPYLDPLLELCLLKLHPNAILYLIHVAKRIQAQDRDDALVRPADAFHALHRGCFSRAVGADQPEDFAFADFKRNIRNGHGVPVGLADAGNLDDWTGSPRYAHVLFAGP